MKEKILLIIPAYNEEKNIFNTYKSVIDYNKTNNLKLDVIVINDGSTDNTFLECYEHKIPTINLIHNLGIGGAVQTGYKYALKHNYDIAIQFDGDGQHDINCIQKLLEPIKNKKADMVIGSRFIKKDASNFQSSKARRIGIKIISEVIYFKTKVKIFDTTSGFRAVNKKIINEFAENYPIEYPEPISTVNMLLKNYKIQEVPVNMKERKEGKSSINSYKTVYYMVNVIMSILLKSKR